jgi:hypothetical protein
MGFELHWLAGFILALVPVPDAEWLDDYGIALRSTRETQQPLLVVLDARGEPLAHIQPVSQRRRVNHGMLLAKYTLCHLDVTTSYGRAMAKAFHAQAFPTTVIIDKSGSVKLVSKIGKLSDDELHSMLAKHQTGERPALRPIVCRT